jgi:endonuclease/exonuclease/phosphatase family metal-dependent hydrolase
MHIKFVSLNLWRGGLLLDKLLSYLEQEQPDILITQEVFNSSDHTAPQRFRSIEAIQDRLHFAAYEFAPALIDNEDGHQFPSGNAIFSRFPITKHTTIPFDIPFSERTEHTPESISNTSRNVQHAVVKANNTTLNVFNVQGIWDLDGDNASPRRIAMCKTIADAARGKEHVLLAGDTNLKPTNPALKPVDKLLHSVFGHELTTSFNLHHKDLDKFPGYATAVVDLMYVSHDVQVLEHRCPEVDISDHLPLVAVVEPRGK